MSDKYRNSHSLRRKFYGQRHEASNGSLEDRSGGGRYQRTHDAIIGGSSDQRRKQNSGDAQVEYVNSSSSRGGLNDRERVLREGEKFLHRADSDDQVGSDEVEEEQRSDLEESYDDEDEDEIGTL